MSDPYVVLERIHENIRENNIENIEENIELVLAANSSLDTVFLNVPLEDETDTRVFNALISSHQIKGLFFSPRLQVSDVESMLQQAIRVMPKLEEVHLSTGMTESQAESFFTLLEQCSSFTSLYLYMGETTDGITNPFTKFLRDSTSLKFLALCWSTGRAPRPAAIPDASLRSICAGIGQCKSLEHLFWFDTPSNDDAGTCAKLLVDAISNSSSIQEVATDRSLGDEFIHNVRNALINTIDVQNFDLCFSEDDNDDDDEHYLRLHRNNPWKTLLPQTVPLSLWPRILAKTNVWNQMESHSPKDALFFLLKEKNDVLLQNVRRRKIRKRKRFQISS